MDVRQLQLVYQPPEPGVVAFRAFERANEEQSGFRVDSFVIVKRLNDVLLPLVGRDPSHGQQIRPAILPETSKPPGRGYAVILVEVYHDRQDASVGEASFGQLQLIVLRDAQCQDGSSDK